MFLSLNFHKPIENTLKEWTKGEFYFFLPFISPFLNTFIGFSIL